MPSKIIKKERYEICYLKNGKLLNNFGKYIEEVFKVLTFFHVMQSTTFYLLLVLISVFTLNRKKNIFYFLATNTILYTYDVLQACFSIAALKTNAENEISARKLFKRL